MNADILLAALARFRRQAVIAGFGRYAVALLMIAAATTPALVSSRLIAIEGAPWIATGAIALALIASVARRPSLRAVAVAVDTRLRLEDRVVTAFQHAADRDTMALLLVRDAARRVEPIEASRVFPFELPRHFRQLVVTSLALAVVSTLVASVGGRRPATSELSVGTESTEPADSAAAQAGPRQAPGSAGRATGTPQQAGTSPSRQRPESTSRGPAAPESRQNAAPPITGTNAARGTGRGAAGRDPSVPATAAMGAGGMAAQGSRESIARAGGAGTGAGTAGGSGARAGRIRPADERYRQAIAGAEAAVAGERVPPGLAAYVKAYFTTIKGR